MVVLASGASLDSGPARDVFLKFADNQDNAIVLISPQYCVHRYGKKSSNEDISGSNLSVSAQLLDKWCDAKVVDEDMDGTFCISAIF